MSDPADILNRARAAGVHLRREGDRIAIRPARLCPAELVEAIRQHKAALLDHLENAVTHLPADCAPWLHVARQVLGGEFDGGDRSTLESVLIGVRGIAHPNCRDAKARLERMLGRKAKEAGR